MKYSIIIPTLNEGTTLPILIDNLSSFKNEFEVIIVDSNSSDKTAKLAELANLKLISNSNGRGSQMNTGANESTGDILLFVHADTLLPFDCFDKIEELFSDSSVMIASFRMKFDRENMLLKIYSFFTRFDSIFTNFGDQVFVVRKTFFERVGGFPNQTIMEDLEFLRKVRKQTKIYKLNSFVITSARRFERLGFVKTQILNLWYIIKYLSGTDSAVIYEQYFKSKDKFSGYNIREISGTGKSENKTGGSN